MMTEAVAGHGATIAMEMDPVGAPGAFDVIAELNADIVWPELSRGETEVTPHQDHIDSWVLSILRRGPLTFGVNYIFDDDTHLELVDSILNNTRRGFRLRGPGGSAGVDEWIASGQVQSVGPITHPVREGARTASVTVRLSGPMIVNGVAFGT